MATIIKATGISTDKSIKSSNQHAIEAGRQCIEDAGIDICLLYTSDAADE